MISQSLGWQPLGYLSSCFREKFGTPRQSHLAPHSRARLELQRPYRSQGLLEGLESFSHVWLIFLFHENSNRAFAGKVRPPRLNGQSLGVLATRSPHRPNPIGLSLAKLEKIDDDALELSGVDMIDGTPILDIKPYIRESDCLPEASLGWLDQLTPQPLPVHFAPEFFNDSRQIQDSSPWKGDIEELCSLIKECLQHDPRPHQHRVHPPQASDGRKTYYGFMLYHLDVQFTLEDNQIIVTRVVDLQSAPATT